MTACSVPRRRLLTGMAGLSLASTAQAQDFPSRPIRIVVAFAAGSEPDILARRLASAMEKNLGSPVVVDNRPGANTVIAAGHVAQSRPDGYTILLTSSTTFSVLPHLYEIQRAPLEQFTPISLLLRAQMALYCNPRLPVRSVAELVAWVRAQPHPVPYGANPGAIGHLCGELLRQATGIKLTDVSFRGTTDAQQMMIRGDIAFAFDGVAAYPELIKGGELRCLGVTGEKPVPYLQGTPNFRDTGFPDIAMPYWYGMFAPANIPRILANRLASAIHEAQKSPDLASQFFAQGAELIGNDPDSFARMIAMEREKWGSLIRSIGLRLG
ncbi:tripartite tricarboxylate transporter substrate binding protein [Roseomonas sp. GC11]|uniref:Bug family tripartite tricarboxylate transporter substrate binding protein n=1 Tax=Roseomonas sp. GC11 TaxID=2950546 RepID=UPI00210D5CDB|nr:tripartite tricarboxylate transporter substrate binding protein [Roseomonas sp. GC11]MCQ4159029.1 tripartite tricarboxylate transporter substrate binding protein [Roseomonas sp. GC11]